LWFYSTMTKPLAEEPVVLSAEEGAHWRCAVPYALVPFLAIYVWGGLSPKLFWDQDLYVDLVSELPDASIG
jgi:hypothetical protein